MLATVNFVAAIVLWLCARQHACANNSKDDFFCDLTRGMLCTDSHVDLKPQNFDAGLLAT